MGDRHNSTAVPPNRTDPDFYATCKNKDMEIMQIAKDNNCKVILQGGDFWTDSDAKPKNDFIADIALRWHNAVPVIGVAGNHDLIGNNINSLPFTTCGLMDKLGFFKLVSKEKPYVIEEDGFKVVITGTSYHSSMDKPESIDDYIVKKHLGDIHIHLVHGMLSPKYLGKLIRHTTIDQIASTKADITLCGHDHIGFGVIFRNGKYFINPGAVIRLKNDTREMSRTVKVVLISINDRKISINEIPLKSALPGNVVLSRDIVEEKKEKVLALESMKTKIKSFGIKKTNDLNEILDNISKTKKIPVEVYTDLKNRLYNKTLEEQKEEKPVKGTKITKLKLVNFQSYENETIKFDPLFNVILGESRNGKTAILRSIRWILENRPTGRNLIRKGEKFAEATIYLENGTEVTRFISASENGYTIKYPDGKTDSGNTKMLPLVQHVCGFKNRVIDSTLSLPVNFMRQGLGWYMIGDELTSTQRARVMGSLQHTNIADSITKDLDKNNNHLSIYMKANDNTVKNLSEEIKTVSNKYETDKKLKKFYELLYLRDKIFEFEKIKAQYDYAAKQYESLNRAFESTNLEKNMSTLKDKLKTLYTVKEYIIKYKEAAKGYCVSAKTIKSIPDIDVMRQKISQSKNGVNSEILIERYVNAYKKAEKINDTASKTAEKINCEDAEKKCLSLKDSIEQLDTISSQIRVIKKEQNRQKSANIFIDACKSIDNYDDKKNELREYLEELKNISEAFEKVNKLKTILEEQNHNCEKCAKDVKYKIKQKIDILEFEKICPLCYNKIDEDSIENIKKREGVTE